jgi:hypothetical protein
MSNQGTIRLKVTNDAPAIEKLWNGRFRLEFLCDNNSPKTDWYSENISSILPEYGILQDTNFGSGVSEDWEAIPDSVYPDMRLVETEYVFIPSMGDKRVKLTYETLTASWVEEKDEDTDYELNGLKRVSRTFVALPDTAYDKVVGTSTIDSNGTTLYLGSFKIEETDAKWSLSESWLEAGELSREENSEDAKGSISITQIGGCPAAPAGYTVVNESKNNTQGFETCSRTFYKDDSELSRSNDYVGSQLAETIEVFSPTVAPTPTNGTAVLGNKSTSNVDGIPTTRYTFLVPSVLSESSDKVGSQLAITVEAFNEVPPTPAGYILANTQASDVEGIVTNRYTFLKPSILSQSEDKVGSQLAITIEAFEETPATPAGYVIANTQVSDVEGIPTTRYTFLKPSVLSRSEDKIGSQLAIVIEAFSEVPETPSNYVLANKQISEFEGVKTNRYTFLEPSILSRSEDKVGSQLAITIEAFSEVPGTPTDYSLANKQVSDVAGIPTTRYTFLKPSILNKSSDRVGSQLAITIEAFEEIPETPTNYSLANTQESDYEGIKTSRYTFLKPSVLSRSEDRVGSQLAITIEAFGEIPATPAGYVLANEQVSDFEGIKTTRYTFLEPSILSEAEDKVGSQKSIAIEAFGLTPDTPASYVLAGTRVSDVAGIPTKRYTFLKEDVELSRSEDKVGSQLAIVIEQFDGIPATPAGYLVANIQESDVEGIPTKRYTFLRPCVLSRTSDLVGSQKAEVVETFNLIPTPTNGGILAKKQVSNVDGIPTNQYTFLRSCELSRTEIDDGSRRVIIVETFNQIPTGGGGHVLTSEEVSNFLGIPTRKYTFTGQGLLSESFQTLSDGLTKTSYTWLGSPGAADGILTGETIGNHQGLQTVTREYTNLPSGGFSYTATVPFTIPGIVSTKFEAIGSGKNLILTTTPPVQTTCAATVDVSYSTNGNPGTSGLYQPGSWATAIVSGIGYNYRPISYTNSMSNYIRDGAGDTIIRPDDGGSTGPPQALMGQFLYVDVVGRIELTGPTADPAGSTQLLSVNADPAFVSQGGVQYYKITKVTAQIPGR